MIFGTIHHRCQFPLSPNAGKDTSNVLSASNLPLDEGLSAFFLSVLMAMLVAMHARIVSFTSLIHPEVSVFSVVYIG